MKRSIALMLVLGLLVSGFAFGQVKAKDGVYFAKESAFSKSGWMDEVVVTVAGGKITKVLWNGIPNLPGATDKKSFAAAGKYGMAKAAKAGEWDKQAAAAEAWLIKTQDLAFAKFDAAGKTDAITGATMTTKGFLDLVNKALASAPVAKGSLKDGWYYKEAADFDKNSGWKDTALVTVVNGSIVDVLWNGIYKDNTKKSKLVEAVEGRYGMAKAAKKGEWNVQAVAMQDAIVAAGDPAKVKADAVTGASIYPTVLALATEALKAAR